MDQSHARFGRLQCFEQLAWVPQCGQHACHVSRHQLEPQQAISGQTIVLTFAQSGASGRSLQNVTIALEPYRKLDRRLERHSPWAIRFWPENIARNVSPTSPVRTMSHVPCSTPSRRTASRTATSSPAIAASAKRRSLGSWLKPSTACVRSAAPTGPPPNLAAHAIPARKYAKGTPSM